MIRLVNIVILLAAILSGSICYGDVEIIDCKDGSYVLRVYIGDSQPIHYRPILAATARKICHGPYELKSEFAGVFTPGKSEAYYSWEIECKKGS